MKGVHITVDHSPHHSLLYPRHLRLEFSFIITFSIVLNCRDSALCVHVSTKQAVFPKANSFKLYLPGASWHLPSPWGPVPWPHQQPFFSVGPPAQDMVPGQVLASTCGSCNMPILKSLSNTKCSLCSSTQSECMCMCACFWVGKP